MAIFDYRGEDGRDQIREAYIIASYTTAVPVSDTFLEDLADTIGKPIDQEVLELPDEWTELGATDLGVDPSFVENGGFFYIGETPFFTDDGSLIEGQAKVLVKKDAEGNVTNIAISFAATNSIESILDFPSLSELDYAQAFEYLFEAVRDYAIDNGLTGRDVLFTGYSLGAGAVNLAYIDSGNVEGKEGRLDDFYKDSDYISFASPAIIDGDYDNIYNYGHENDVVFRVGGNNLENPPELIDVVLNPNPDVESQTSTDNIVLFDEVYASKAFPFGYFGLLNLVGWVSHIEGSIHSASIFDAIADSHFYEYMERDSSIIISDLSDHTRGYIRVAPVDRVTGDHADVDSFVLGSGKKDLLGDSTGSDFIDAYGGDDNIRISEGNDSVHGGEGTDTLELGGSLGDYEAMRLSDGTTYLFDTTGEYGLKELTGVEKINFGFGQTYKLTDDKIKWTFFKAKDYENVAEGTDSSDSLEGGSSRDRMFGLDGNDGLFGQDGNDLLHGGDGNDLLVGGTGNDQLFGGAGDDAIIGEAGNDTLSGGLGVDTFVFQSGFGNDTITDYNMGEQGDDLLVFSADVFASYDDVMAAASQQGDDVLISSGDNSLLIEDTNLVDLTVEDFVFG